MRREIIVEPQQVGVLPDMADVVIGHRRYFAQDCPSEELTALAEETPVLELKGGA